MDVQKDAPPPKQQPMIYVCGVMSVEQVSSLLDQGVTKTYQIPIGHLDYGFIEKCTDVKYLEKILKILRSGEEGMYPDLISFCEKRIESLAPNSRVLRRDKPAATASDFTAEEWERINEEMKSWVTEMNEVEYKIRYATTEVFKEKQEILPPVRSSDNCHLASQSKSSKPRKQKVIPRNYSEWDKFDVEKECSKIDGGHQESYSKVSINNNTSLPKTDIDTAGMTSKEKNFIANREKEKGNEAFVAGDYKEAVAYYNRSISAFPTVAAYNNKAQAEIKLQNWHVALQDCETVLRMDSENIKGFMRRSTVYKNLHKFKEAAEDLKKVLHIEPENAIAKKNLSDIEKKLGGSEPASQTQIKGKRIPIQDIEESDGEDQRGNETSPENGSGDKKTAGLVGGEITSEKTEMGNAQKKFPGKGDGCKSEHKEAQKHRVLSEASVKKGTPEKRTSNVLQDCNPDANGYISGEKNNSATREIKPKDVESSSAEKTNSVLLPPTAATLKAEGNELFKNGQFGEAVLKYSQAIENVTNSGIQSPEDLCILYSNRAACYLKEGNCVDCIQDCNRITRTLIDQDGPNWREKLSPIPVVPVSAQLHWWDGENFTSESKQKKPAPRHGDQISMTGHLFYSFWDQGEKPEETFKTLKNKGNEFVKKGKYEDALLKYSECLKLNPKECTIYTNRALCFLKLCRYEEAKADCDHVLQTDGSNVKALYRRALAHKGLQFIKPIMDFSKFQNYKASIDDLNKVLLMDPSIEEAKKELQETTQLLKIKNDVIYNSQQKPRKKIEIQEVNQCEEEEIQNCASTVNHRSTEGEPEITLPLNNPEKLVISKPSNAYEFGQILNVVNANKDISACAELLMMIEPKDLPVLLSNKLEGDVFVIIIQALQLDVACQDPGLAYQHLFYLGKAERFKMVLTLLSKNEMEQVQQLFDSLSKEQEKTQVFSLDDLENLKRDFEL
ncbi:hypothetical protein lerEdw1_008656 [Lerista edwardsae]|nr:hypothetical protein lerEdw1_008656 [Lerista edwardsae]